VPAEHDPVRSAVDALLDDALAEVRAATREDLVSRLTAERDRLAGPTCAVLVIGEFNKGKSSLVNALLNARVCATDADVATAVPTFVRYGDQLLAGTRNGQHPDASPVDPTTVEALVTAGPERGTGTERGTAVAAAVEIALPRALLRDGLVLVDTPGVGGGLHSAHAAATLRALASADAVVFVSDASQELTAAELDLLRRAAQLCPKLVLALTKIDFYPEWRLIRDIDAGHLGRAGLSCEILPLSAPLRHHALRVGDRGLVADSGFPALAAFLRDAVATTARSAAAGAAAAAHSALHQLVSELATEHGALADPDGQRQRLAQWTEAKRRAEELRGAASRWQQTLVDRIGDMSSAVDFDITTRLRTVRRDASGRLATTEPGRGWVELEPWIHQSTNEALADHLRLIKEQADLVTDEVAEQFGVAAWELRVEADVGAVGLNETIVGDETGLAALAATRASILELGIGAMRGGSAGVLVTHAAGLVIGLALPVTLPVAALLAAVLGRFTWRSAKAAQARMLRAEAERAVAGYLDEVEVRARKDSRDAVRRVNQHLRTVFAGHAAELHASTVRNLEVLTRSVRADQKGSQQQLGRTSDELARLRALAARAGALVDELLGEPVGQPR